MHLQKLCVSLLLIVGLLQVIGKVLGEDPILRSVGYATAASPLPEVFGAMKGEEPMTYSYEITAHYGDGSSVAVSQDQAKLAKRLQSEPAHITRFGPYLLSIIWGNQFNPTVRDSILRHGMCNNGPLARIFQLSAPLHSVTITYTSRSMHRDNTPPPPFEVTC